MKARLRTETWHRLRLIAQAENLPNPLAALDYVVKLASAKMFDADQERLAAATKERDAKRAKAKKKSAKR